MVSIRDALTDPNLFGEQFGGDSWAAWRALLAGFYGLPLSDDEAETFKALTQRQSAPESPFAELWLPVGRRGGKTIVAAAVAVFEAAFFDYRDRLAAGEVATVMVIAADRRQARTAMRYVSGLIYGNPMLRSLVVRDTTDTIELSNRSVIEVHTASFRAVRGYTLAAVVADEIAFWHVEGASPDKEIVTALRPAMATLGGKLIAVSSPYAKRGMLWSTFKRYFASDDDRVLVAQAPSLTMNPTLPPLVVERALRDDPEAARAEYLAEFRGDISAFLDIEQIEDCTRPKPRELGPVHGVEYRAFVDPAGGGADGFSLAIVHKAGEHAVVDLVRERHGSPADAVREFVDVLRPYGIRSVTGDRYAGQWPRDEFGKFGISYETSDKDRSALYMELLASLNSGRVELPPNEKLARQLVSLERRTSRAGRDIIDHPPGGHDDLANAVAGAVALSARRKPTTRVVAGIPGFY